MIKDLMNVGFQLKGTYIQQANGPARATNAYSAERR